MKPTQDIQGPIIRWDNYGVEGWKPTSFQSVRDALLAERYNSEFIITRVTEFQVVEAAMPEQ